jgi:hypothetical protein
MEDKKAKKLALIALGQNGVNSVKTLKGPIRFTNLVDDNGETVIDGGYIKTDRINVDQVVISSNSVPVSLGTLTSDPTSPYTAGAFDEYEFKVGDLYYNSTEQKNKYWNGSSWENLGSSDASSTIPYAGPYTDHTSDNQRDAYVTSVTGRQALDKDVINYLGNSTTGQKYYVRESGTWNPVALYIDGSAVINGTLTADKIQTSTITISSLNNDAGYTSFSAGDVQNAIDNNVTTISGSKITTGTIDASQVSVTNLNADNITSGSIAVSTLSSSGTTSTANGTFGLGTGSATVLGTTYSSSVYGSANDNSIGVLGVGGANRAGVIGTGSGSVVGVLGVEGLAGLFYDGSNAVNLCDGTTALAVSGQLSVFGATNLWGTLTMVAGSGISLGGQTITSWAEVSGSSGGDMNKSTYDTNNDGIVNNADYAASAGVASGLTGTVSGSYTCVTTGTGQFNGGMSTVGNILALGYIDTHTEYRKNGAFLAFTGGHITFSDDDIDIGDIIYVESVVHANISQTFQKIKASVLPLDKRVFGISAIKCSAEEGLELVEFWCKHPETGEFREGGFEDFYNEIINHPEYYIYKTNSIGEGQINVCEANGDIDNGDYICSSNVKGKGQKQDDDFLHSYTVAKALESVIWNDEVVGENGCFEQDGVKCKMIACTYHCG